MKNFVVYKQHYYLEIEGLKMYELSFRESLIENIDQSKFSRKLSSQVSALLKQELNSTHYSWIALIEV